jgi:Anti-sigma-K factor rskA
VGAASRLDGAGAPRPTESSQLEGAAVQGAGRRAGGRRRLALVIGGLAAAVAIVIGVAVAVAGGKQALTYHAALGGTQLAPDAHGDVTLTQTQSGWRVALHASGLPRLDNGQFYQAWLKDRAGVLVPIGTFNQPADVTLWSGVPPYEYPMFTVTRQRAGQLASSGQRVLTGSAQKGG